MVRRGPPAGDFACVGNLPRGAEELDLRLHAIATSYRPTIAGAEVPIELGGCGTVNCVPVGEGARICVVTAARRVHRAGEVIEVRCKVEAQALVESYAE